MTTAVYIVLIICGTLLAGWAIMWNCISNEIKKSEEQNRKDKEK